jgi:leucyl/phenylalanyl-tRNA---protein transferase
MPIYALPSEPVFPPTSHAEPNGLLAVGGDLSPQRLLNAYASGIFPWYSEGDPILWWSTAPRMVLFPSELIIHKSMRSLLRGRRFRVSFDQDFPAVIGACATMERPEQDGTWIVEDMVKAYIELHRLGYAHSVEVWEGDTLVGGLYGIALGRVFFGESMFARVSNASKYGFIQLVLRLHQLDYTLIDCQQETPHIATLGARPISRQAFTAQLEAGLAHTTHVGSWARLADLEVKKPF